MRRRIELAAAALLIFCGQSHSAIVRYDFTGEITSAIDNDPPTTPAIIFGTEIAIGDAVTGFFEFDTAAAETASQPGASAYNQSPPLMFQIQVEGSVFRNDGVFATSVGNDLDFGGGTIADAFAISDGVETNVPDLTGTMIVVDDILRDGRISLQFNDFDATAFISTALPSSLNLADFELSPLSLGVPGATGRIFGTEPSGQVNPFVYSAEFSIDSLTLTAVPEPTAMAFCGLAGICGLSRRRRNALKPAHW